MTKNEKRFIRREIINGMLGNKPISRIKNAVRIMERFMFGFELNLFKSEA